jgi:hypothetical protein
VRVTLKAPARPDRTLAEVTVTALLATEAQPPAGEAPVASGKAVGNGRVLGARMAPAQFSSSSFQYLVPATLPRAMAPVRVS